MNRFASTPYKALLGGFLLGLIGLLLNWLLPIEVYYRLSFLLGSIGALLALDLLGARAGMLVGLLAASGTLLLWGQPFPFLVLAAEIAVIALLHRRLQNMMAAACLYWLLLGGPVLVAIYHLQMKVELTASLLYALKFAVNGVFNALLASLLLLAIRFVLFRRHGDVGLRIHFAEALTLLLTAIVFIPTTVATAISLHMELEEQEQQLKKYSQQMVETSQQRLQADPAQPGGSQQLQQQASFMAERRRVYVTLLDQQGAIIVTTSSKPPLDAPPGISTVRPIKLPGMPWIEIMRRAVLVNRSPMGNGVPREVLVETPYAPVVAALNSRAVNLFGLLFGLMVATVLSAKLISVRFGRSIHNLELTTASLPLKLSQGQSPSWPNSFLREVGELTENIRQMADSLASAFSELRTINDSLEERVSERTSECAVARDAAQRASQAKGRFLAVMSHEIRTPMNAIMGITSLLRETSLNPRQRELLDCANDAATSLLQIINDILDFSRIEANRLEIYRQPFSLKRLLEALSSLYGVTARCKQLEFVVEYADGAPDLLIGDEGRLRQVLSNLMGNALKFTEQGRVSLKVAPLAGTDDQPGLWLRFEVSDTGIGIPLDKQLLIFDMFSQVDDSTTRRFGGTGLGLAISKQLVELMGGSLMVQSSPGHGSCFSFELPFELAKSLPSAALSADDEGPLPRFNILLAEDNPANQLELREFLSTLGQDVVVVADGRQLLAALARQSFDLVLTDISMPEMDGLQAVAAIRSGELPGVDSQIPVIAMTAHALSEDRDRFLSAGLDGYVTKPVEIRQLVGELRRVMPDRFNITADGYHDTIQHPREKAMIDPSTTSAAMSDEPLDRDYLERNYLALGCADVLVDVVAMYLESVPHKMAGLQAALAANDSAEFARLIHGLKGESGSVGARLVTARAASLEQYARQGDLTACSGGMPELEHELQRAITVLQQEFTA
jgi:signal transduction histidine kinase/DNA-binding response OmpR family regulator